MRVIRKILTEPLFDSGFYELHLFKAIFVYNYISRYVDFGVSSVYNTKFRNNVALLPPGKEMIRQTFYR